MRKALIAGAALLVLLLATPFLVPFSRFIPQLTRLASEKLGQPIEVADLKLHLLPTPRAIARDIRVGRKGEASIGELEIVPDVFSFIAGPRAIRLVRAESVQLKEAALAIPASMPKGSAAPAGDALAIRRIELKRVRLQHSAVRLPEFDAEVTLTEGTTIESASFLTRDGALRVSVKPQAAGVAKVEIDAHKWTLPAGPPLVFDNLNGLGTLKGERLDLPAVAGKIYGGSLSGSVRAEWGRQWQLGGKVKLVGVDVAPVQQALGKKPQLSGRLTGDAAFSARAKTADQLGAALALDGPFEVLGGAYQGMDLSQVTELTTGKLDAGGATRFDELSGKLQLRGKRTRVNDLCVRSKSLVAGGYVEVGADQQLSGKLDVSVARTKGFVGVPVALGGTTSEPSVSLTKGAMIGAVVGTVLLPGLGTGLGASAGNAIEGKSGCN